MRFLKISIAEIILFISFILYRESFFSFFKLQFSWRFDSSDSGIAVFSTVVPPGGMFMFLLFFVKTIITISLKKRTY